MTEEPKCEGDGITAYDTDAKCYRVEGCPGCEKCIIKCSGCVNCTVVRKPRDLDVGDYVVIHSKLILDPHWKHTWSPIMDLAVGRVGFIEEMKPQEGYRIRFKTTHSDALSQCWFPKGSLRLAMPGDNKTDKMIKEVKGKDVNWNV